MSNNSRKFAMVLGIAALAAILTLGLSGTATAFHGGGVAHCDGCHSMHYSADNPAGEDNNPNAQENSQLLKGTDPSSTCLNCHQGAGSDTSYHSMSTDATVLSAGGDFFWLTQSYSNVVRGNTRTSDPDNMGHNVVAGDFSLDPDATNLTAPGGTVSSAALGCDSCHDPHGQIDGGTPNDQLPVSVSGSYGEAPASGTIAGNYRILRDFGVDQMAPIAVIASVNGSKYGETDDHHVAYGEGMSEWCGACHPDYVSATNKHVASNDDTLGLGKAAAYNSYVGTGDFGGAKATGYLALVPFEEGVTDIAALAARSILPGGAETTSNVMCLTCHRAHASAFNNVTRWDMETELLAESLPSATNLTAMGVLDPTAPYYGRTFDGSVGNFGAYQRSLCNKCHGQD